VITGALTATSVRASWVEQLEVRGADDEALVDLSAATEITVSLTPPLGQLDVLDDLTLRLTTGGVTIPSLGIVQWRAERNQMAALQNVMYEVRVGIDINGDSVDLLIGELNVLR
jgi:hypothetical protein